MHLQHHAPTISLDDMAESLDLSGSKHLGSQKGTALINDQEAEAKVLEELVPLLVEYSKSPDAEAMDLVKTEVVTVAGARVGQKQAVALWQIRRMDGALNNFGWTEDGSIYIRASAQGSWKSAETFLNSLDHMAKGMSNGSGKINIADLVLEILVECQAHEEKRLSEGTMVPRYSRYGRRGR